MVLMNTDKNSPLKLFRLSQGKTQLEVARELGIDTTRISDYENGRSWIKDDSVAAVAAAFGCPPGQFLELLWLTRQWANEQN